MVLYCTASQMWCLALHLPFLIGDQVPEDNELWQLFIKLLSITAVCFAPVVSQDQLAYLQVLIEEHHKDFCRLYPNCSVIPKMHYMVHMPSVMQRYIIYIVQYLSSEFVHFLFLQIASNHMCWNMELLQSKYEKNK